MLPGLTSSSALGTMLMLLASTPGYSLEAAFSVPCAGSKCAEHASPVQQTSLFACRAMIATPECQRLKTQYQLRDCDTQPVYSVNLSAQHVLACLAGAGIGLAETVADTVATPFVLAADGIRHDAHAARYYDANVYRSCREAERAVRASANPGQGKCGQTFWHAACPENVLAACKDRLVADFPELKMSYGARLADLSYDHVLNDVHDRLRALNEAKPSLRKFLADHPDHPVEALARGVLDELNEQKFIFACVEPLQVSLLTCDRVMKAVIAIQASKHLVTTLRKPDPAAPIGAVAVRNRYVPVERLFADGKLDLDQDLRFSGDPAAPELSPSALVSKTSRPKESIMHDYANEFLVPPVDDEIWSLIGTLERRGLSKSDIKAAINKLDSQCSGL